MHNQTQVLPTSGTVNCSLWDASSADDLLAWLQENLDIECSHEVYEVLEDFALGLPRDLARMRAAEAMSQGTRDMGSKAREATVAAAASLQAQVQELDSRLHVSEQASHLTKTAMENAAAALAKVQLFARNASQRAMENERVAATVTTLDSSWRRLSGVEGAAAPKQEQQETTTSVEKPAEKPTPVNAAAEAPVVFTLGDEDDSLI